MADIFGDIDHVSSILVPFGATAGDGWRIFGISAVQLAPDLRSLLLLCDRGAIYGATVEFVNLSLSKINFHRRTEITAKNWLGLPMAMDAEGMVVDNSTGEVFLSSEPSHFFRLPLPWQAFVDEANASEVSSVEAEWLPFQPSKVVEENELPNQGLEAFTLTANNTLLAGLEGPLVKDDPSVRRLMEVDQTGRLLWSGFMLVDNVPSTPLLLSELATLKLPKDHLGGPFFLGLERRWSRSLGNDIRLYLLQLEGASNVSHCNAICDGACAFQGDGDCYLEELTAIRKHLLFQWTPNHTLKGLMVDNYEAMTVVAPEALGYEDEDDLGGVAVLLVNDNNDNPRQIGTQFVLLRLPFARSSDETVGEEKFVTVLLLVVLSFCTFFLCIFLGVKLRCFASCWRIFLRTKMARTLHFSSHERHMTFEDHDGQAEAEEGVCKLGRSAL